MPNDPNCSIHVFYKGRLQCLKKKVSQWLKTISIHFDHYNLINKEKKNLELLSSSVMSQFQNLKVNFTKKCLD